MPALIDLAKWFRDTIGTVSHFADDEIWRFVTGFSFIKQLKRDAELQAMIVARASRPEPPKTDAPPPTAVEGPVPHPLREEWNKLKHFQTRGCRTATRTSSGRLDFWREKIKLAKEGHARTTSRSLMKIVDTEAQIAKRSKETQKKVAKDWKTRLQTARGVRTAVHARCR
jgi:hypothetical protein